MKFTKTKRIEITGGAIANRLKGRGLAFSPDLADKASEAAQGIMDERPGTIAEETLLAIWNDENFKRSTRDWNAVVRQAKKTLAIIG